MSRTKGNATGPRGLLGGWGPPPFPAFERVGSGRGRIGAVGPSGFRAEGDRLSYANRRLSLSATPGAADLRLAWEGSQLQARRLSLERSRLQGPFAPAQSWLVAEGPLRLQLAGAAP